MSSTAMNDVTNDGKIALTSCDELRDQKAAAEFVLSLDADETHETTAHENTTAPEDTRAHNETNMAISPFDMADTRTTQLQSTRMQVMRLVRMEENSERPSFATSPSSPTTRNQVGERVYPGAVAVPGPDATMAGNDDDEYTTTAPSSDAGSLVPVMARLVNDNEYDVQAIQEQLRAREEQLLQVLAERENVAVAQVIDHDEEAQNQAAALSQDSDSGVERKSLVARQPSMLDRLHDPRRKGAAALTMILGGLVIVLGVVVLGIAFANVEFVLGVADDGRLSTGAIIAIIVVECTATVLLAGGGYWLYHRRRSGAISQPRFRSL